MNFDDLIFILKLMLGLIYYISKSLLHIVCPLGQILRTLLYCMHDKKDYLCLVSTDIQSQEYRYIQLPGTSSNVHRHSNFLPSKFINKNCKIKFWIYAQQN